MVYQFSVTQTIFTCDASPTEDKPSCDDGIVKVGDYYYNLKLIQYAGKLRAILGESKYDFTVCYNQFGECGFQECFQSWQYSGCVMERNIVDYCLGLVDGTETFEAIKRDDGTPGIAVTTYSGDPYDGGCHGDDKASRSMRVEMYCNKEIYRKPTHIEVLEPTCKPDKRSQYIFKFEHSSGCPLESDQ